MWGWSKRSQPAAAKPTAAEPTNVAAADDMAMEAVAHFLRTIGRMPIDGEDEQTTDHCEAWAQHVLLGRPPPNRGDHRAGGRREWGELRQFISELRRRETERTGRVNNDLRDLIWSFVKQFDRSVAADDKSDQKANVQLERLRRAATDMSFDVLKQEVLATIHALGDIITERNERHRREAASLSAEMQALSEELIDAKRQGAQDPLTELQNRRAFDAHLMQTQALRNLFGEPACVMMIDVDHFKKVNDTHGHLIGDAVLKRLAHCLALNFPRRSDCVARYGGEEFAVVLRDASLKEARLLGERVLTAVRNLRIEIPGGELAVTVSIGLSELGRSETVETCVARADKALYTAKQSGRNQLIPLEAK